MRIPTPGRTRERPKLSGRKPRSRAPASRAPTRQGRLGFTDLTWCRQAIEAAKGSKRGSEAWQTAVVAIKARLESKKAEEEFLSADASLKLVNEEEIKSLRIAGVVRELKNSDFDSQRIR